MSLIQELQARVKLLTDEREALWRQEESLKAKIVTIEVRLAELNDRFNKRGLISRAKIELAKAELERDDEHRPLVVFTGQEAPDYPCVVHKVTPKRIYVRRKGRNSSWQFHRDGRSIHRYGPAIDLKATFGDDYANL